MIASINPVNGEIVRLPRRFWKGKDRLGRIMTLEMGKPIGAARAEAAKCALACRYYAEHGESLLADEPVDAGPGQLSQVSAHRPGAGRDAVEFSLLAGLPLRRSGPDGRQRRPAEACFQRAAMRPGNRDVIRRAGFPADVFQTLLIGSAQVARVIDDPRVKAASLTGSEPAGAQVAAQAGRQIKKTVLELGGSDPFVVMPSADLDRAVAPPWRRASSTTANPASPPSASSWTPASPPSSSAASWKA
jgi:succinate-semialdehyde dehydrogenase / glutarate-semialdehyde dehydrogenase